MTVVAAGDPHMGSLHPGPPLGRRRGGTGRDRTSPEAGDLSAGVCDAAGRTLAHFIRRIGADTTADGDVSPAPARADYGLGQDEIERVPAAVERGGGHRLSERDEAAKRRLDAHRPTMSSSSAARCTARR